MKKIEDQQYKCALTGRELTPSTASADHIVPISKGGSHSIDNIQIVHVEVNQAKGTLSMQQFVEMCRDVVRFMDK